MLYSSLNGCFYYYDSILFRWQIAEPTLLFLLGLEAITSYKKSSSDEITLSKYAYYTDVDKLRPLEHMENIYDDIYSFLSKIGSVEDFEHYLKFNCYGLKLLLNEMTGTGNDMTVPIIFKSDVNKSLADPTKTSVRLSESAKSDMLYYDLQAQKIYNIFTDAGYDTSCIRETRDRKTKLADYYIDKDSEDLKYINKFPVAERKAIRKDINVYNSKINEVHSERLTYSEIYRLLDYKAMYAYALGVLYGCRCIGYDASIIWRLDPKYWYKDSYMNLARTAWYVFRFRWTHPIEDVSDTRDEESDAAYTEKYQGIQDNKIWNFTNDDSLMNEPIEKDESNCYCLFVSNDRNNSESLTYSFSKELPGEHNHPGSYIKPRIVDLKTGEVKWYWYSIDDKVSDGISDIETPVPAKGVVSANDSSMIRYIGNDPVTIYRAYRWFDEDDLSKSDPYYLAPTYNYEAPEWDPSKYVPDYDYDIEDDDTFCTVLFDTYEEEVIDDSTNTPIDEPEQETSEPDVRYKKYYVYTGHLGWVDYNENLLADKDHQFDSHNYLYVVPRPVTADKLQYAIVNDPDDSSSGTPCVVTYYKCYVTDRVVYDSRNENPQDCGSDILYGIYYKYIKNDGSAIIPTHFDAIISGSTFDSRYTNTTSIPDSGDVYFTGTYYDITTPITLITRRDADGKIYIWDDDPSKEDVTIFHYGYAENNKTILIPLYERNDDYLSTKPTEEVFRYNKVYDKHYWSATYFGTTGNDITWEPESTLFKRSAFIGKPLYCTSNKSANIYKCETKLIEDAPVYYLYSDKLNTQNPNDEYIYVNQLTYNISYNDRFDFTLLGRYYDEDGSIDQRSLYLHGYTTHLCPAVTEDDNGNSLTDDNDNPLVWYDSQYQLYWNGLFNINRWQKTKPSRDTMLMWDTESGNFTPVFANDELRTVSIDGDEPMSYDEFYSDNHRGIIRTKLDVFKNVSQGIIECYCDYKDDPEHLENGIYCIPNITDTWMSRSEIHDLGWWFVDGTATLYSGDEGESYVIDDDHRD